MLTAILTATDWEVTETGQLAILPMNNAPYPDASRSAGYTRADEFYPAELHYHDPSVAIFVPAGFRQTTGVNLLFFFHGHNNNLRKSFDKFRLREMVKASGQNLIMVFPQGPKNARDSGCGKLETLGGFRRLVSEVIDSLRIEGIIASDSIRSIIVSGHSGAYLVIGQILKQGGMTDKIHEVYLLDASYGSLEIFTGWVTDNPQVRLCSIFTDHLAAENVILMKNLSRNGVDYELLAEEDVSTEDLNHRLLFLHAENLTHGETVSWLERFLATARFDHE